MRGSRVLSNPVTYYAMQVHIVQKLNNKQSAKVICRFDDLEQQTARDKQVL